MSKKKKKKATETQNKRQTSTQNIHQKRAKVNTHKDNQSEVQKTKRFAESIDVLTVLRYHIQLVPEMLNAAHSGVV